MVLLQLNSFNLTYSLCLKAKKKKYCHFQKFYLSDKEIIQKIGKLENQHQYRNNISMTLCNVLNTVKIDIVAATLERQCKGCLKSS